MAMRLPELRRRVLYLALGIIALYFPVIFVSNRTYVAPSGRESEFPPTRVATWRSLLQKTQFLTARSINTGCALIRGFDLAPDSRHFSLCINVLSFDDTLVHDPDDFFLI